MQRLRQNLLFKIVSLIGAFALFLYVQKQQATESPEYFVPLEMSPPPGLTIVDPSVPRQARVKLKGPAERIRTLDETQIKAIADLAGRRKGTYADVSVTIHLPPGVRDQVQIVYYSPVRLRVRLDEFSVRQMQVEPVVLAERPAGYSIGLPRLEPTTVEISGLGEAVKRVKILQAAVTEFNSTERLDQIVRVNALDENGKEVGDGLQLRPPTVRVRASIERSIWSKPIYVDPDLGPLPAGTHLKRLAVIPDRVTVTGSDDLLSKLWVIRTESIRLPNAAGLVERTVRLEAPPGVRQITPSVVRVEIELEGVTS